MKLKRIIVIFLIVVVCISFIGCNKTEMPNDELIITPTHNGEEQPSIEYASVHFYSYDEYLKFINSCELPSNFVYY